MKVVPAGRPFHPLFPPSIATIAVLPSSLRLFVAILIAFLPAIFCFNANGATGWSLIWADEFDQPEGSLPDASRWVLETGGYGWGNKELQTYTARTNNCRIENGHLVIEARQESFTGTDGIQRNYTSARLKTQGKVSWKFGRVEARIKIPRGQGMWPAFWMLGTNITSVSWPACGEIDIMENIGSEPSKVHGAIHGPGYSGGNAITGTRELSDGAAFADDFHLFAIEWQTNVIRWFVDGQPYMTVTPARIPQGATWVFNAPEFLLLNVAVGGNWPGSPNASTAFPQRMTVDFVRVYAATNTLGCAEDVLVNPGFESGLGNWTLYGANTQLQHSTGGPVHSGTNSLKVFGRFSGAENFSGAFQDLPCQPGERFHSGASIYTLSVDRIAGSNEAWLEVSFRDGAGILSLYRTPVINSASAPDKWHQLDVIEQLNPGNASVIGTVDAMIAPAGSTFARCQVVFRQRADAVGSVYADDVWLTRAGGPELPVAAAALASGGTLQITFPTYLGFGYELRRTRNLAGGPWHIVTNLTGDGRNLTIMEALDGEAQFYQVKRVCN